MPPLFKGIRYLCFTNCGDFLFAEIIKIRADPPAENKCQRAAIV